MHRYAPALLLAAVICVPASASAQATGASSPPAKPAQLPADSMEIARKYTQWFYTNQADSLIAHMDSAGRGRPGAKEQYQGMMAELATRAGTEKLVMEEKFITRNGARQYWRTTMFSAFAEPLLLRWVIGPKGQLVGAGLGPASQAPPIDP